MGDILKIIQVCQRFYPCIGGIETHVFEISKRMAKKHDVQVFTTDPSGQLPKEEIVEGIKIKRFKSFAPNEAFFFCSAIYWALKEEKADILHIHSNQALSSFLAFKGMDKDKIKKFIFTPHYCPEGTTPIRKFLRKFYDNIQNTMFLEADKVICVSEYEMELLNKNIGLPWKKMIYIPNGINLEDFKISKTKKDHGFQILFVGRLEKYKRAHWILYALKNLKKKYPAKNIHFVIVGKGPYKDDLISLSKDLGLEKNVTFKQDLSYQKLLEEYSKCDVFVLPSAFEIFGIVVLEALAFNKPIIVSNDGALPKLFGNYGSVINSVEGLEKSLAKLIDSEGKIKTDFDISKFTWDSVTNQILKLYKRVLK
jgi:glycosyltransferase involved in cell wall biosynthesis